MTLPVLIFLYSSFAVVATLVNLATQRLIIWTLDGSIGIVIAMLTGTIAGLIVKYFLDKRWIFKDIDTNIQNNSKKFFLYSVMGLVTTAIFWCMEMGFWIIWQSDAMRETGAVLGLCIGYVVKYNLDRRFVFQSHKAG